MIDVWCPADASKDHEVEIVVKARSNNISGMDITEKETDQDRLFIIVGGCSCLTLKPQHPLFYHAQPGEWLSVPINITNLGNKDFIDVEVWVEEDDHWRTSYRDYEEHYTPKGNFLEKLPVILLILKSYPHNHFVILSGTAICIEECYITSSL